MFDPPRSSSSDEQPLYDSNSFLAITYHVRIKGNIVLMTHLQYQNICLDILKNMEWYCLISADLVASFEDELHCICLQAHMKGKIDSDTLNHLINPFPRIPTFYAFPKVHVWGCIHIRWFFFFYSLIIRAYHPLQIYSDMWRVLIKSLSELPWCLYTLLVNFFKVIACHFSHIKCFI